MKFRSIHLENYRSHSDTTFALDRVTVIRGANHSGKSSIEQAIETLLARRNATTGANGQGLVDSIRFGEDKAVIEAVLDHAGHTGIELRASITPKSGLNVTMRRQNDKEWNPVELGNALTRDRDILSCLTNNRFFVNLDEKKQKALLASIALPQQLPVMPESIMADLDKQAIPLFSTPAVGPLQEIDRIYKRAFEERTTVNRMLKEWHAPEVGAPYQGPNVDEIRAKLNQRRDERVTLALKKQALQTAIDSAKTRKAEFERKASEADTKAQRERTDREEIAKGALSKDALKKVEKEAKALPEAEALDKAIQTRSGELSSLSKQLSAVQELGTLGPQCPTCRQAITEELVETLAAPVIAEFDSKTLEQRNDFDKRKALGDPAGAQKKLDAHKTVEADLKRIDTRIANLEREAQANRDEALKIDPDTLPKPETIDPEIQEIDGRIEKGTSVVAAAASAAEQERARTAALARKKELDEEHARLERLVAHFGPSGIKATLIQEHIGPFQSDINKVLQGWGYECALVIEPEYGFKVSTKGSEYSAHLQQLSLSEQYRFSVAFSVALAVVSGWKFVVCDGADILDEQSRSALNGALLKAQLDQAIILATDARTVAPPIPGVVFIRLSDTMENGVRTTRAETLTPALVS